MDPRHVPEGQEQTADHGNANGERASDALSVVDLNTFLQSSSSTEAGTFCF